jgi:hypothetical protein
MNDDSFNPAYQAPHLSDGELLLLFGELFSLYKNLCFGDIRTNIPYKG